jgi:hypothetical protein
MALIVYDHHAGVRHRKRPPARRLIASVATSS